MESGGALVATDCKDGQVIGSSRFHAYNEGASEIEIGWTFVARSHWGGVHNREMKQLMLRHAFQFVNAVIFLVGPQNIRSQKAVEKIAGSSCGVKVRCKWSSQHRLSHHSLGICSRSTCLRNLSSATTDRYRKRGHRHRQNSLVVSGCTRNSPRGGAGA